jgi:5-formyltetrahydrofolate cyclo-ligase
VSDFGNTSADAGSTAAVTKRDLRRRLLAARRALSAENRENQDQLVRATVTNWLNAHPVRTVAAYVPMLGEPGGPELPESLSLVAEVVLLPAVLNDRDLDWAAYHGAASLRPAALGLSEPSGPRLGADAIAGADVVLVPALAIDRFGSRLGRGGGSYDRALARVGSGVPVLALLYAGELVDSVPSEEHDRPVRGAVIDGEVMLLSAGHERGPAGR